MDQFRASCFGSSTRKYFPSPPAPYNDGWLRACALFSRRGLLHGCEYDVARIGLVHAKPDPPGCRHYHHRSNWELIISPIRIFSWLFGKEREIRNLNSDSVAIVEMLHATLNTEQLRATAQAIRDNIHEAHQRSRSDPSAYAPIISHFRVLHQEARNRHQQRELSVYTLVIIYLRAEALGPGCKPARDAVDEFAGLAT